MLPAIISDYNYSITHYRNLKGLRYGYISVKKVIGNKEMRLIFINLDSIFTSRIPTYSSTVNMELWS